MQERKTNHILLYLACQQMVFGIRHLQKKELGQTTKEEWCTRASQSMQDCARIVDNSQSKIFALEFDNSNCKIFRVGVRQLSHMDIIHWS